MNTYQKNAINENQKLIEKFKRQLKEAGIPSIRDQATDKKHIFIHLSETKKLNDYKFKTEKQREKLLLNYINEGEKMPCNAGYFSFDLNFFKLLDKFSVREVIKIISMTDPDAKKIAKVYIENINNCYQSWTDTERKYNFTTMVHLYMFYKTLIKNETERKLIQYLENKK